jgi:hypothetical protein
MLNPPQFVTRRSRMNPRTIKFAAGPKTANKENYEKTVTSPETHSIHDAKFLRRAQ